MQSASAIALRIFSGPHLGAELQLPVGDYIIGSEDSCDLILVDGSLLGRHAVIHVAEQAPNLAASLDGGAQSDAKATFMVSIAPLDGQIFVTGELVLPQGMAIAPCTLFEVGTTSIAWNTVGAPWSDMSESLALSRGDAGASGASGVGASGAGLTEAGEVAGQPQGETLGGEAGLGFYDNLGVGLDGGPDDAGDGQNQDPLSLRQKAKHVASLPLKTLAAIFLAILCVCGVMVSFEGRAPDMVVHAEELETRLHDMGMTGLSVIKTADGIVVSGVLDSDAQRTELWRVTSGLLYPVEIDATVREDLLSAVTAAFNSRHMYPAVVTDAKATGQDDIAVQISGYFQDGQVEAWAFQAMHEDVPTTFTARRNVRHQDEVQPVLESALFAAKLQHVRTRFMPGVVQVAGHFDLEQHAALDDVLIAVQDQLGVPVRFEVYADLPKSIQVAAATNTSDARALEDAHKEAKKDAKLTGEAEDAADVHPLGQLKVVSVTLTPLCFFTTDDGQRFFEGAVLPSGYSVEKITMDALTLKKNGAEKVHDLRGHHD